MSAPRIRVRIRRLVLDGVDPAIGDRLAAELDRQLRALVERYGVEVPGEHRQEGGTVVIDLGDVTVNRLARALASTVHERLRA